MKTSYSENQGEETVKKLHNYQNGATDHILDNTHSALFMDMGLGKTVCTLTAIDKLLFEELEISKVLVVAPKRVAENVWDAECAEWPHLSRLKISKVVGTEKQRQAALAVKAHIYTIGRDNVAWLCGLYGGSMLPFDMLVIDELSSFKNPKSVRFKALRKVQPSLHRVVGLTGTPAPNGLIDLWSQLYLLDRGERLGKFITDFRDRFFTPGERNGHIVYKYNLRKDTENIIHEKISDICISMKAKDYLELPGRVDNIIKIPFPPDVQQKYDDFEREQVLHLFGDSEERESISAINAAVLSNKLLQFANGAIYDEDRNVHELHKLKLEAAKELVEDANGKPVLIAWTYRHDMTRLKKHLKKYDPRELKTGEDIKDWNNGKIQVLLMHPASGGHGLNLQAGGNIIIWFGQTWSLELYQQLNARLDRQGQKEVVVLNRLVASKTMDEDVIKATAGKDRTQSSLMDAVSARISKYMER
ncbi:MAG: DEAD/DEAH box helicase [Gammaproteobacteria bacterium]|nr:DEAD/DEAH box helicase [Gammaproteobacteria bacterium]